MCISGAMYMDEDHYEQEQEKKRKEKEFYTKNSFTWDYYSNLPNPKSYEE